MSFKKRADHHQFFAAYHTSSAPTLNASPVGNREDVHMKKLLILVAAGALSMLSFSASAEPQQLTQGNTGQLRPAGTVSVSGAYTLDDLQDKLAEKAHEQGAKGFVVNSASGDNKMYGTATIYK